MQYFNVLPAFTRSTNKYPFTTGSSLLLDNILFPINYISSFKLILSLVLVPVYMYKITVESKDVLLHFADKNISEICTCRLAADTVNSSFISPIGTLCGSLTCDSSLYHFLYDYTKRVKATLILLDPYNFIVSGLCMECIYSPGVKALHVNDKYLTGTIELNFRNNIVLKNLSNNVFSVNTYGNYDKLSFLKHNLKYINGVDLRGCCVIVKPSTLSDLRVRTTQDTLTFSGVKDV